MHRHDGFLLGSQGVVQYKGNMPRPKAHYSLTAKNHVTREILKIDLINLPWTPRIYRLRVKGKAASKLPVASKTKVLAHLRKWWVAH
jgi:hypothetical protein